MQTLSLSLMLDSKADRYIPSEKIGQFFDPPEMVFWHKFSSMDLRECILAIFGPPSPLGGVRGGRGGSGGVRGTKIFKFFGATFGFQNAKFWIV